MTSNFVALFLLLLLYSESCCAVGGSVEVCLHQGTHNCSLANSLDEALGSLSSDSTVSLSPGLHMIQTFNLIRDLTNIRISGNSTTSSVTIECTAGVGLAFFNISGLVIENLNINRCELSGGEAISELRDVLLGVVDGFFLIPNDTKLAVFLGVCTNVTMNRVMIANTTGLGLMGINVMGEFSLSEVRFESNIHPACITDRLEAFINDSLGSQIGGGAFIVYHCFHDTNNDQHVNLSIRKTSFIRNADCSPNTFVELYYQFSEDLRDIGYIVGGGGGLTLMVAHCNYTIDVRINSSTFQGNTARYGSGAHIGIFNDATNCRVLFTNCTFIGNGLPPDMFPTEQGGSGVAILNDLISPYHGLSRPTVHNKKVFISIEFSNFTENTGYAGAGVYVYSQHSTATVRNESDATIVMCSHCLFTSNSATLGPAFFANALKRSAANPGIQIKFSNIIAEKNFVALLENGSFRSVSDSSAVIDIRSVGVAIDGLQVIENRGTGLLGTSARFSVSGNITIAGNVGEFGGGMRLISYAFLFLQRNATITFTNNIGIVRGGAVYVALRDDLSFLYDDCFLHIQELNVLHCKPIALEQTGVRIEFSGNYAPVGSTVYGSTLSTCCWTQALRDQYQFNGNVFEALQSFAPDFIQFDSTPTGVEEITTLPNDLVVSHNHSTIIPGQSITIGVAAFDQFDQYAPTVVTSTVLCNSCNTTSLIGNSGYVFLGEDNITDVSFRILGPENQTVIVGIYSIDSFADTQFTIQVSQCSPGFIYNHFSSNCSCIEKLMNEGIKCDVDTQTLEVPNHLWMGPINEEDNTVDLVHECVLDYCHPGSRTVPPGEYEVQCAEGYNRTGLLCGTCVQGYSTVFGTNRCLKCSNTYLVLIVVFIVAGILLVLAISLLKITVTRGYLNGILFYCNVISLYANIFAPGDSTYTFFIFISLLNNTLGIDACFYDGMDALARTGLQLLFPAYLFLLMGLITVLARSKYRCSKCFINSKFNANEMFGTLLILCYSSILESCIEILGVVRVQTLAGDTLIRWVVDPTVPYFHGWHGVLGAIAIILVLLYTALFPLVLLFPTYVYQYLPKLKPFFDALYNPFKKEFRFWLAFRLILRSIPLVLAVFVRYPLNVFILAICLIVLHYIQLFAKPFQTTAVNITDGFLLMNAIILTLGALFFDSALNTASEENQSTILTQHTRFSYAIISTAYAVFLCILLYYIYLRLPEKLRNNIKDSCRKNADEGAERTPIAENHSAPPWTTSSVRISRTQHADDIESTPRIPLLDQSHQGQ